MKWISAFFRWLLTMNAVWGLMIVSAFVLTVYQHYAPECSKVSNAVMQPGENNVVIKLVDKDEKEISRTFRLMVDGSKVVVPETYAKKERGKINLLSARMAKGLTLITWDYALHNGQPGYGSYTMSVNEQFGDKGKLVTLGALTDSALTSARSAFNLGLGLVSTFVLFLGLMKVGEDAGLVQFVARVLRPAIRVLFPEIPPDHPASGAIIMNFTTSMLGLGNAATPFGLKAIAELQSLNKNKAVASDSMVVLLAWNTAGFAVIPTSLIAIRTAAGCSDPLLIIGPCMIAGIISTITGLVLAKTLGKLPMFSLETALREEGEQPAPENSEPETPPAADDKKKGA